MEPVARRTDLRQASSMPAQQCFDAQVNAVDPEALTATGLSVLQLNLGLRCTLSCRHCHQSASPQRTETMSQEVFEASLRAARRFRPDLIDVTGGAPELHPHFRAWLSAFHSEGLRVQVRTNLTVLLLPDFDDLPDLFASLGVQILASFPSFSVEAVDSQRGPGTFAASLEALRRLNRVGYATGGLRLDLAANPPGPELPGPVQPFEAQLRQTLAEGHGLRFDGLRMLANMPIGRFGAELRRTGGYRPYLDRLRASFNPATVPLLACRTSLVVNWDGALYDCDFNLGAGLPVRSASTIHDIDDGILTRRVACAVHCFACTARAGSS